MLPDAGENDGLEYPGESESPDGKQQIILLGWPNNLDQCKP
jgi:hypothetical protein